MQIHQSAEDYLETILMLNQRMGRVRSIDVVNELGYTKASVSIAMKKLRENGYIAVDGEGNLTLLEQGGIRPVLIVQNEIGNRHSPTVIAAAITSRLDKARLPTHINIRAADTGLAKDSVVLLEQIRTLDKHRLRERAGQITPEDQRRVNQALDVSLGLDSY